ncbi:GNAT family N-acetyltransferase [Actinocatenispora sera]|uniref:GNAT family N-acetyltransferase n=1 Tax=Actinocatenispora sera TaxID=390989 RepID=UPI0033D06FE8
MTDPTKSTTNKGIDTSRAEPLDLTVINDEQAGVYGAFVGDREIAGLPYTVAGPDRLVLLATSVFPEFRHRGVGTELVRRALDDIRTRGKTVTIMCPIVRSFVDDNPRYADLIDARHPGVTRPR